jgi:hypothetical protein
LSRNANAALQQLPGIPRRILEAMALGHAEPPSVASAASAAMAASWITSAPQFVPFPPGMPFTLACILHPHFHPMPSHKQSRTPTSIPHPSFYLTLSNLSRTPGVSRTLATIPLLIVYLAFSHISRTCVSILCCEQRHSLSTRVLVCGCQMSRKPYLTLSSCLTLQTGQI